MARLNMFLYLSYQGKLRQDKQDQCKTRPKTKQNNKKQAIL